MIILRRVYYSTSPKLRFLLRKIYYLPSDLLSSRSDLEPPKGLIYTGTRNFIKQGEQWREMFIDYGLKSEDRFLDIGSGIGRIAVGLTPYLKGKYEGFEAIELGVLWCKENITIKFPNFNFRYVALYNDLYNSGGQSAETYRFEYEDSSFDFAASISVFSHMIDKEVVNYLSETHRVLKGNGILVATFFIMNEESKSFLKESKSDFDFKFEFDNYFLMDKNVKSANVAFKEEYLLNIINGSGFIVVEYIKGHWCGRTKTKTLAFQDILVLRKIENFDGL